uniref:EF-hand domain-containing protein n=1 Tax=Calcidiscus leptoporus TaxID=127549 RepID=A0A7S0JCU2_9EUKA|mmetsp:Transcript_51837/g.119170  ORF Transcript_51837/g.119170 Transcript_51837/m.119170 type:complete len:145 (+) Transcript_51837:55-489(+)
MPALALSIVLSTMLGGALGFSTILPVCISGRFLTKCEDRLAWFQAFDRDKDGTVSADDLLDIFDRFSSTPITVEQFQHMLDTFVGFPQGCKYSAESTAFFFEDHDGDGLMSRTEWASKADSPSFQAVAGGIVEECGLPSLGVKH